MRNIKTILLALIIGFSFSNVSFGSGTMTDDGDKKSEAKEVTSKKSVDVKETKITIGSRVIVSTNKGDVEATVVNKIGKKKYFIRAYGDANRIGYVNEKKLRLK